MTFAPAAPDEPNQAAVIGSGLFAGVVTLLAIGGILWFTRSGTEADGGATSNIGESVGLGALAIGDCFDRDAPTSQTVTVADCEQPHTAEVAGSIEHPDAGGAFPGTDAIAQWIVEPCEEAVEGYIETPTLETILSDGSLTPNAQDWSNGDESAVCYVSMADSTLISGSVQGAGDRFARGDEVEVSRLLPGDCFNPMDDTSAYDLNSNSTVAITQCDEPHNGIFFGRDRLSAPLDDDFPGAEEVGTATSQQCGELFQTHFGVDGAGFNYRYWRPNEQSWDAGDRQILCAILDDTPFEVPFDPSQYRRFFDLPPGTCFDLGPEETSESLRLDDQVRQLPCDQPHVGQMLGSGELENPVSDPFPPDDGVLDLAGAECETLFAEFVGISPFDSTLGNFPFWYPNESGWNDGDRRFACAFLDDEPQTGSYENAEF